MNRTGWGKRDGSEQVGAQWSKQDRLRQDDGANRTDQGRTSWGQDGANRMGWGRLGPNGADRTG